jgi:biopolymer transport protein ExbD
VRFRTRRRRAPEINLTSLIDVVFLLLIFFMVSTTFDRIGHLKLELPKSDATAQEEKKPDRITVAVDAQGHYYVNDQELINTDIETLKRALQEIAGGRADVPLVIAADGKAQHQAVVTVMDAASQLGLTHLAFSIKPRTNGE